MRKAVALCSIILLVGLAVFLPLRYLKAHQTSDGAGSQPSTTSEEEPEAEGRGGDPDAAAVHIGEAQLSTVINAPPQGGLARASWGPATPGSPPSPQTLVPLTST
jgi:hypothetical protein